MATKCYTLVRGSAIRATALDNRGRYGSPITYVASKATARIDITEVTDSRSNVQESSLENERRVRVQGSTERIRTLVDISFTCVDPALYQLVSGTGIASPSENPVYGYGEGPFDLGGFGGDEVPEPSTPTLARTGIEVDTRTLPVSFALEVWSKLAGQTCEDGTRMWGYTLFQHLRGGRIGNFAFSNGLVSFNLVGAQSRRNREWGVGPYDLEGDFERMTSRVSRNNNFRQMITNAQPPVPNGTETLYDVIGNGNAANPMPYPDAPLVLSGGGAVTSPYIISGGRA